MTGPMVFTAALAGVPAALQAQGVWMGRRQLFVRFSGPAETATMYRADGLARELDRQSAKGGFHSIAIAGSEPLANIDFLGALLAQVTSPLPVMLDTDGAHAAGIEALAPHLDLVQVTLDLTRPNPDAGRATDALRRAAAAGCEHALVVVAQDPGDEALGRIVDQAHAASAGTQFVVHPVVAGERAPLDRRWAAIIERATALGADARLAYRLPGPAALR